MQKKLDKRTKKIFERKAFQYWEQVREIIRNVLDDTLPWPVSWVVPDNIVRDLQIAISYLEMIRDILFKLQVEGVRENESR